MIEERIVALLYSRRVILNKLLNINYLSYFQNIKFMTKLVIEMRSFAILFQDNKEIYKNLNTLILLIARKNNLLLDVDEFEIEKASDLKLSPFWFQKMDAYAEQLVDLEAYLMIQGSYADGKITNYSDVDLVIFFNNLSSDLIILKKEIESYILKIDPLQHHGIFMIDRKTINFYWQMDLPVEVLQRAKVFGKKALKLGIKNRINENLSSNQAAMMTINVINRTMLNSFKELGIWRWKFFLSQLMLLPTLLLASKGNYCYKGDSFHMIRKTFSQEAWHAIEEASRIRATWPNREEFNDYIIKRNSVTDNDFVDSIRLGDFGKLIPIDENRFKKSLKKLCQETEQFCLKY